jgi:hypothetical protein
VASWRTGRATRRARKRADRQRRGQRGGQTDTERDGVGRRVRLLDVVGDLAVHPTGNLFQVLVEDRRADQHGHQAEGDRPGRHDQRLGGEQPAGQSHRGHQPSPIR